MQHSRLRAVDRVVMGNEYMTGPEALKLRGRRTQARGRVRHESGSMNKTERAYYDGVLAPRLRAGELAYVGFECLKLRLAKATFYDTDFLVQLADGTLEVHEVKGFMEDDAAVKLKVAAETFPWLRILLVQKNVDKSLGADPWVIKEIEPR